MTHACAFDETGHQSGRSYLLASLADFSLTFGFANVETNRVQEVLHFQTEYFLITPPKDVKLSGKPTYVGQQDYTSVLEIASFTPAVLTPLAR